MDNIDHIVTLGRRIFDRRSSLLSLWQELAENFYPERANFTSTTYLGEEYGDNLMSSFPVLTRRDLGDSLSSMLRPTSKQWFHLRTKSKWEEVGVEARAWLEGAENAQRRAMYHRPSQFVRALKEADHDFATFGQAAIQVSLTKDADSLLFRTHHLRDVAWIENDNGVIDTIYRRRMMSPRDVCKIFPKTASQQVKTRLEKEPYEEVIEVWHVVMPADEHVYERGQIKHPFRSLYIESETKTVLEDVGAKNLGYVIPRWRTVSGSQYAVSPATCIALPDARMLQSMVGVLLEVGEKAANPPMVAAKEIFRGDVAIYAGGITWADLDDRRVQDVFNTIPADKNGIPFGAEMARDVKEQLVHAFYLNKLSLPPPGVNMTAYEVGQRVQEYIRQAMPLFEPIEDDYNSPMCEMVFDALLPLGTFGSTYDIPKELAGAELQFSFESPLHDAIELAKAQKFAEARATILDTSQIDPTAAHVLDIRKALRDSLQSSGTPSAWLRSERDVQARVDQDAQQQQQQIDLQNVALAAKAQKDLSGSGAMPPAEDSV